MIIVLPFFRRRKRWRGKTKGWLVVWFAAFAHAWFQTLGEETTDVGTPVLLV